MSILEDTYQYLNWEFMGPCFIAVRIFQGMGFSERPNMRVIQEDIAPPNALDRADRCSKKKLYVFFFWVVFLIQYWRFLKLSKFSTIIMILLERFSNSKIYIW